MSLYFSKRSELSSRVLTTIVLFLFLPETAYFQLTCQVTGSPQIRSGAIAASDPMQTGRVVRDGAPSTCTGKANVLQNTIGVHYDSYAFTNSEPSEVCVRVDVDFSGCGDNQTGIAAYSNFDPANPSSNLLGDLGFSTIGVGSFSFPVAAGATYKIVVHEIEPNFGCQNYTFTVSQAKSCRQPGFDLFRDGKADLTMFNTVTGIWRNLDSRDDTTITSLRWGLPNDKPVVGDFTGDGSTEFGIFRPSDGTWWHYSLSTNSYQAFQFGSNGDIPAIGDYDGDYKTDVAIFRPSTGDWYVLRSRDNSYYAVHWGQNGDFPQTGDFDGDGRADIAVWRPSNGGWYVWVSNFGYEYYTIQGFGLTGDKPVAADYDGDAITDLAVYRPSDGTWYVLSSADRTGHPFRGVRWGVAEDIPQPADYDGDMHADVAVWRPSSSDWYILGTTSGFRFRHFGEPNEIPVTSAFNNY